MLRKSNLLKVFTLAASIVVLFAVACGGSEELVAITPTATPVPPTPTPIPAPTAVPPTPIPAPVLEAAPVPQVTLVAPASDLQLSVLIAKRNADNSVSVLKEGGEITSQDHYGIFFRPTTDAYVYIFQQDSSNAIDVLFPNPDYSTQSNPVPAGMEVWVPNDIESWFFLDDNVGQEAFMVVARRARNDELESILNRPVTPGGELLSWLQSGSRGVGGVKKSETAAVALPDGANVDLAETLLGLEQGEGGDFIYKVPFEHK